MYIILKTTILQYYYLLSYENHIIKYVDITVRETVRVRMNLFNSMIITKMIKL